jgi:hypothetical protein
VTQIVGWNDTNLNYDNNDMRIECGSSTYPSAVTGPLNIGVSAAFTGTVNFRRNITRGGSYSVFTGDPGCPCSGTINLEGNFTANAVFQSDMFGNGGFLYPNQAAYPNLTIPSVRSAVSNQALNFRWNNAGVTTTVTSVPRRRRSGGPAATARSSRSPRCCCGSARRRSSGPHKPAPCRENENRHACRR